MTTEEPTPVTGTDSDSATDSATDSGRSLFRRPRAVPGHIVVIAVYLAVCVGLLIWAFVESSDDGSGGSMAAVVPILAAAPVSFVWIVLPGGVETLVVAVALGALANAAVIAWCGRTLRRGKNPDPTV